MLSLVAGLAAAFCWGTATICSSRSSRMLGAETVVAWVMAIGLVILLPVALVEGVPAALDVREGVLLLATAAVVVVSLTLDYAALRVGRLAVVGPIVATEGAVAAAIAVVGGETLALATAALLGVVTLGVVLVSIPAREPHGTRALDERRAIVLALVAAVGFGATLVASGHLGRVVGAIWVVLVARAVGALGLALPLALRRRLRMTRRALPLVAYSAVAEIGGYLAFIAGARHEVAVTAVLASQFAAVSALGGYLLFGERLSRTQLAGVLLILAGVAVLSGLRA
jgi:drug/metabolite transporter (DMT)-like permease